MYRLAQVNQSVSMKGYQKHIQNHIDVILHTLDYINAYEEQGSSEVLIHPDIVLTQNSRLNDQRMHGYARLARNRLEGQLLLCADARKAHLLRSAADMRRNIPGRSA